mmetsp:Transcript_6317/g.14946  ORF Transcript_6317/g.14946 Transcript_6317/m.14946 type:complete len:258 (-) Transcript_6317:531-1304(-)
MIARAFVASGANVLLTSRSESACREASEAISPTPQNYTNNNYNNRCHFVASNVSDRKGCEALAEHASELFDHKLDVLINNAGAAWGEPLDRTSGRANWGFDKVLDLNVKGVFYLTRACLPMLEESSSREDPSRIINIGSVAGLVPQAAPTHAYDVSKAAVHQLTKKLSADLAPKQITVNALAPGYVSTRMTEGLGKWGATEEAISGGIPLGRMGTGDDMAGACLYLSSRAGSWCTGVILNVDGGTIGSLQVELGSHL